MKSIIALHHLVQDHLRRFKPSFAPAWVSGLFAFTIILPLFLVGSCKEGTSIAVPDISQAYAMVYTSPLEGAEADGHKVHISKSMIKAHKRQMRGLLKDSHGTIVNLHKGEVYLLFSKPDLARHDGPVSSWQYRNEGCVVDIFFTQEEKNAADKVVHYEIRPRQTAYLVSAGHDDDSDYSKKDEKKCLSSLLDRNKDNKELPPVIVSSIEQ